MARGHVARRARGVTRDPISSVVLLLSSMSSNSESLSWSSRCIDITIRFIPHVWASHHDSHVSHSDSSEGRAVACPPMAHGHWAVWAVAWLPGLLQPLRPFWHFFGKLVTLSIVWTFADSGLSVRPDSHPSVGPNATPWSPSPLHPPLRVLSTAARPARRHGLCPAAQPSRLPNIPIIPFASCSAARKCTAMFGFPKISDFLFAVVASPNLSLPTECHSNPRVAASPARAAQHSQLPL
jgi:hypothetical protein